MKENPDDWSVCEVVDGSETLDNWVGLYDGHKKLGNMDVDVEMGCYRMMTPLSI